jgi:uroporphyrinogen decarboxylase
MNSRERILAAAKRQPTDRPPTSLRCTPEAWDALRKHLNVETNNDVLDLLDIDLRWIPIPFCGPEERSAIPLHSVGTDMWGCHNRECKNEFNTYIEFDYHPLEKAQTIEDIENHDWPSLDWWDYSAIQDNIKTACSKEPRSCMFFAGGTFETPWYIRGMEKFMMDFYDSPEIINAICTRVGDYYLKRALRVIDAAAGDIDLIGSGGDIGGQNTMLLNPDLWREHIKPHSAKLISTFKDMGLTTFYHSCGAVTPVINDFIEMGLDILDPIQIGAKDMEPENLSTKFGDRLTFHGAIDEVNLLPHASADEVYNETKRIVEILGQNNGYIVSPSHMVQGDTPPENVVAIFKAVNEC